MTVITGRLVHQTERTLQVARAQPYAHPLDAIGCVAATLVFLGAVALRFAGVIGVGVL
jgi:hypothetical protein